jgi:hypothetical protein
VLKHDPHTEGGFYWTKYPHGSGWLEIRQWSRGVWKECGCSDAIEPDALIVIGPQIKEPETDVS